MRVIDFNISTLKRIKYFNDELKKIEENYEGFELKTARKYLRTGSKDDRFPDELYDKIEELSEIRKKAISNEMTSASAKASRNGQTIPEKYLTGESLTPFFNDTIYSYSSSFNVYDYFQWYSPDEIVYLKEKIEQEKENQIPNLSEFEEDVELDDEER